MRFMPSFINGTFQFIYGTFVRSVHNLISNRPDEISATEISLGRPRLNTLRCSSKFNRAAKDAKVFFLGRWVLAGIA